jgi:NAD-dependent histone deacetylase SIR2
MTVNEASAEDIPLNPMKVLHVTAFSNVNKLRDLNRLIGYIFDHANKAQPTKAHRLIERIHSSGILLRYYTQNIDGIDDQLGVPRVEFDGYREQSKGRYLQLHGSVRWMRCSVCQWREPMTNEWVDRLQSTSQLIACPLCPSSMCCLLP